MTAVVFALYVLIAIVAAVLIAFGPFLWRSRDRLVCAAKRPYEQWNAGRKARHHHVLVKRVLDVARKNGVEIAAAVKGTNPAVVTFSSGRWMAYYRDFSTYVAYAGPNTYWGKPPLPIGRWTDERLRSWLKSHR